MINEDYTVLGDLREFYRNVRLDFNAQWVDPPYNQGEKYKGHNDSMSWPDYMDFAEEWVGRSYDRMADGGTLFILVKEIIRNPKAGGQEDLVDIYKTAMRKAHYIVHPTIIWAYTFGQFSSSEFYSSNNFILNASKGKMKFYGDQVRTTSWRQHYRDKRHNPAGKTPSNVWLVDPTSLEFIENSENPWDRDGIYRIVKLPGSTKRYVMVEIPDDRFLENVWCQPRLPGNASERKIESPPLTGNIKEFCSYCAKLGKKDCKNRANKGLGAFVSCQDFKGKSTAPNQLPESIIERAITGTTRPGDLVLDGCSGNMTARAVCRRTGRRVVSVDLYFPDSIKSISIEEMMKIVGENGE